MDQITKILPFLIPIILLELALMVWAVVDIARRPHVKGNKIVWLLVVIFVEIIGPIVYFIFGRGQEAPVDGDSV
jgi:hypothetical protein